ncbi:hypothetical protein IEQ34_001764 [Dendrobium chrysotoxum]|uniref:AP-5 complex subunit beta-1 n=1 Tax=Dendrobium chrysotoxum TaxID=161865 RepID=A0AAV7HM45_DENCH|nr:hypothetical protein IEQ34_001764 [Dendrobium chrysotoxum]
MEKQTSDKSPYPQGPAPAQQLSPQDWETLIDDFQSGIPSRRMRWLPFPLLDFTLSSLFRKDIPVSLKAQLLLFLEDSFDLLFRPSPSSSFHLLLDSLRSLLIQYPGEFSLKEQAMISTTSIAIAALDSPSPHLIDPLTELLLSVANRPNHGPDRHMRSVACECLRELELAYPLLLSDAVGHIWFLAQTERTHAAQSYALLLATAVASIARHGLLSSPSSILSTSVTLVPFNSSSAVISPRVSSEPTDLNLRELRRIVAFLLERPQALTPCATMELVSVLVSIVGALERHMPAVAALLKVQFSCLLYCYDPILCHVVLMLYSRFSDAFSGDDELGIFTRLANTPNETQQTLVFRLLAIHWLLGSSQLAREKGFLSSLAHCLYPLVFDPLALKAAKLDALAVVAAHTGRIQSERDTPNHERKKAGSATVVKLFYDGLVCVSAFKWLPPWSTETSVAFRSFHRFLIGVAPHYVSGLPDDELHAVFDSSIFQNLQDMLVELASTHRGLVPVIAFFVDRLMGCNGHQLVGERLLQTLDEKLLPKLYNGFLLGSYFPIFERIARNDTIPPCGLLQLLTKYMLYLTVNHGSESGLRSWSQGSKVLGICRTMLVHHRSSRVFLSLSHLLSSASQSFPDLEVRDSARICLRMLLCIPGKKLKTIINFGGQLPGVSPSTHPASLFQVPLPRYPQDANKRSSISAFIHLERAISPLVKQSWSLTLPSIETGKSETSYSKEIKDVLTPSTAPDGEADVSIDRISLQEEALRVIDSKVAETLRVLRRHFACIPDYRCMPGTKIGIPCLLRFEAGLFNQVSGFDSPTMSSNLVDNLPALYAIVITFKSTAKYGSIPACHVPFLLGEPSKTGLDVIPIECEVQENSCFRASIVVELEPREPMPGLIDAELTANIENGQIISGLLQSITVGIEDMFLKAGLPSDVADDKVPQYYLDLFHALWEACGSSANTERETFPLHGGKGAVAIYGTRSVKLLDVSPNSLISATEQYLAPFVVSVAGQPLVNIVGSNGVIKNVIWEDDSAVFPVKESKALVQFLESEPLQLEYTQDEIALWYPPETCKRNLGTFLVLIFLPPRFHLLFQMEVGNISTLVRIRTDHWPCLAYVDEYLESLVT